MSKSPSKLVSVVVPVFEAAEFVETAVLSALEQPETAELILIEDGSTDGSLEICERLAKEKPSSIRLLRHEGGQNHGAGASRNLGIRSARADYIAFLDADDQYLEGRFATSVALLEGSPDVGGVYEAVDLVFENDHAETRWRGENRGVTRIALDSAVPPEELLATLVMGTQGSIHTNGITVRRTLFEQVGHFDEELRFGQDTAMWWKLASTERLVAGCLDAPVATYRRHDSNRATFGDPAYLMAGAEAALAVYRWSVATGKGDEMRSLLLDALGENILAAPFPERGWRLRVRQLRHLIRYAVRCPRLVTSSVLTAGRRR